MAENKTKPTGDSVIGFLNNIPEVEKRESCLALVEIMTAVSNQPPVMWGSSIVGFGTYHYKYESGREGDSLIIGFAPRKTNIAIYLKCGVEPLQDDLARLGKFKMGKSCLYIKKLADVDQEVFRRILFRSFASD